MKINWMVRIKNKAWWLTLVPALFLLAILGIVNDPTTAGMGDSEQALTYEKPKSE